MGRVVATLAAAGLAVSIAGAAYSWPGPPKSSPPRREHGPPAAWAESTRRSFWLAFGSYCWTTAGSAVCVDMIPPQSRADIPAIRVLRGAVILIHLAFAPRDAHFSLIRRSAFKHNRLRSAPPFPSKAATENIFA